MIMSHYQRALLADLTAMRELCVQLDKAKDAHSRQVVTVSAELEQVLLDHVILSCIHLITTAARKNSSSARREGCIGDTTVSRKGRQSWTRNPFSI